MNAANFARLIDAHVAPLVLYARQWCGTPEDVVKGRHEQRFALLRHVEALRLYAAEHERKLPANLSDVTAPLPDDPFTGKPIRYEVAGNTAHLRGTPPSGMEKDPAHHVHYEVLLPK
jgi:hypothetical protein